MTVFDFDNYKEFVRAQVRLMPKGGHGMFQKIARALEIHSTMASHIFNGEKELNTDQALMLAKFFGLSESQTDYLISLVHRDRASTPALRGRLNRQIERSRKSASELAEILPKDNSSMSEKDWATFYSNWYYSAIRLLCAIPKYRSREKIGNYFSLPMTLVNNTIDFLLRTKLVRLEGNQITFGPVRTHVESSSPLAARHHANWRLKAIERFSSIDNSELVFTTPVTIATSDVQLIRSKIVEFISELDKTFEKSKPERLFCFNVDFVEVK